MYFFPYFNSRERPLQPDKSVQENSSEKMISSERDTTWFIRYIPFFDKKKQGVHISPRVHVSPSAQPYIKKCWGKTRLAGLAGANFSLVKEWPSQNLKKLARPIFAAGQVRAVEANIYMFLHVPRNLLSSNQNFFFKIL